MDGVKHRSAADVTRMWYLDPVIRSASFFGKADEFRWTHRDFQPSRTKIELRFVFLEGAAVHPVFSAPMYAAADLFDLSHTEHALLFEGCEYAWEALKKIKSYLAITLRPGLNHKKEGEAFIGPNVLIGEGTVVEYGAMIKGPAIIGRNCQIRHNAYIREDVIIGDNCVVGNSCEFKTALLFNHAVVPHFSYVGDSILGYKAHLGAGVKISNVKLVPGNVTVEKDGIPFDTGLRKFGALVGDHAEVGCNSVLNPGSILGRGSVVYPNTFWRGILPANMIVKNRSKQEIIVRRPRET